MGAREISRVVPVLLFLSLGIGMVLLRPIQGSQIVGAYVADYSFATENLTIRADHSFSQRVTLKSSNETIETSGTWTYVDADHRVTFIDNFLLSRDGFGRARSRPERGAANFLAMRTLRGIQIGQGHGVEYRAR